MLILSFLRQTATCPTLASTRTKSRIMGAPGQAGARFANRRPPGRDGMAPYQLLNQLERFLGFVVGHVGTIPAGSSAAWGCPSFSSLPHPPPGDRWCTSTGQAPRSEGGSDQERADGGSLISLRHGGLTKLAATTWMPSPSLPMPVIASYRVLSARIKKENLKSGHHRQS